VAAYSSPRHSDFNRAAADKDLRLQAFKRDWIREQLCLMSVTLIYGGNILRADWLIAGFIVWNRTANGLIKYPVHYVALLDIHSDTVQEHLNAGRPTPFFSSLRDLGQWWHELQAANISSTLCRRRRNRN
jgi:hypothetical protein